MGKWPISKEWTAADIVEQPIFSTFKDRPFLWPSIFLSVHFYDRQFSSVTICNTVFFHDRPILLPSILGTVHFYNIIILARITLAEQIFSVNFDALPQSSFQVYSCLIYLFVNNYFCVRNEHIRTVRSLRLFIYY